MSVSVLFATSYALGDSAASSAERLRSLRAQIAHHDELYFKKARPEITDGEYDRLKTELVALEKAVGNETGVAPNSPASVKPGDDRSGQFPAYQHGQPMLSLEKAYSEADVRAFCLRVERALPQSHAVYVVEPKFDGVAISATYLNGKLFRAATRGDGRIGDDVTENVRAIAEFPQELRATDSAGKANVIPALVELRGEIFLTAFEFTRINSERSEAGEELFAHPRNLAAGSLKQRSPADVAKRNLSVVFYGVGEWRDVEGDSSTASSAPSSQQALHARLGAWGMPRIDSFSVAKSASEVWKAIGAFGVKRTAFPFPTDGVVVKLNATSDQRVLGESGEAPRWAIAYKFAPERISTQLLGITLQVGRTGVITPVAELAAVEIGGTRVSRATLHNADEITRRDLRLGDYVYVEKAGEIVPAITGVDFSRREPEAVVFVFPTTCPSCASALVRDAAEGAEIRCDNHDCPAQLQRRIEHFVAPAGMAIRGFGPALIEVLVRQKSVTRIVDIYGLKEADFITPKSGQKILAQIELSKRVPLNRVIYALSIPEVGRMTANALAARFATLNGLAAATAEELRGTDGVSAAAAETISDFLLQPKNRAMIAELVELGVGSPVVAKTEGTSNEQ